MLRLSCVQITSSSFVPVWFCFSLCLDDCIYACKTRSHKREGDGELDMNWFAKFQST